MKFHVEPGQTKNSFEQYSYSNEICIQIKFMFEFMVEIAFYSNRNSYLNKIQIQTKFIFEYYLNLTLNAHGGKMFHMRFY